MKNRKQMTASVQGNKPRTHKSENERYLIRTRKDNVRIFGKFCFRQSDERTNIYEKATNGQTDITKR